MKMLIPFAAALLIAAPVRAESVPGETLLSYFQANCRQGEWTTSAMADSRALIETLRVLVQSEDCKSLGGAISNLNLLNTQLAGLQALNTTQQQIASLDSREQTLMVQLSQSSDPLVIEGLNTSLREVQLERAGLMGVQRHQEEWNGPSKLVLMNGMVQLANTTFSQIAANQLCLRKNPSILNAAAGVMSAVGSAAVFVNPALGLGLTAGGSLLGATLEGVRHGELNTDIRRIADNSIAMNAYRCAMDTMTAKWCQMRDAESLLRFKAEQRNRRPETSGLEDAIRLSDREIPRFIDFLERVRNGVSPGNTADASRQNAVLMRETSVRINRTRGLGAIDDRRQVYESTPVSARWDLIRTLVESLAPRSNPGSSNEEHGGPLSEVLPNGYAQFFLLGIPDTPDLQNAFGYISLSQWYSGPNRPTDFKPTLDSVKERFLAWMQLGEDRVNQELSVIRNPDPLGTLSGAYENRNNPWRISLMDSVLNLIAFLEKNPPGERDYAFRRIYAETLATLREIHRIIDAAVLSEQVLSETPLEQIYSLAQLKYGTVVYSARLEMIVRISLLALLETAPPSDQVLVAQLLAANRFTDTIKRMNGLTSPTEIQRDIQRGQSITYSNMDAFVEIFGENLSRMISRLKREESRLTGQAAELKRKDRAELCFLLLGAEKTRFNVATANCSGLQLQGSFGAPSSITITAETFRKPMAERACVYQDHFRNALIYETRNGLTKRRR